MVVRSPLKPLSRAPGSGREVPAVERSAAGGAVDVEAFQVSKSWVSKVFPENVVAYRVPPSGEYQTRSTGPPASPAREKSTRELPMGSHAETADCAWTAAVAASARIAILPVTETTRASTVA